MAHRLVLHAAKGSSCTERILLALAFKKLKHEVIWYTPDWTYSNMAHQASATEAVPSRSDDIEGSCSNFKGRGQDETDRPPRDVSVLGQFPALEYFLGTSRVCVLTQSSTIAEFLEDHAPLSAVQTLPDVRDLLPYDSIQRAKARYHHA